MLGNENNTMTDYSPLEKIARNHQMRPEYLREIVYLSATGHKQNQIHEKADIHEDTVSRYRRLLREMNEEKQVKILQEVTREKAE